MTMTYLATHQETVRDMRGLNYTNLEAEQVSMVFTVHEELGSNYTGGKISTATLRTLLAF